ncbi:hypothetical protein [Priestia aryabhattai]|uniref:hypothetical protein n=1 Tax=Priestia aryabhattai TaxID=412384 RepID=UPI00064E9A88|nr:hypothetical protein [Priestia aryabhattai]KML27792.1 hypothetical protein VL11_17680 [Priestia aryabhattai]KMO01947.1 hypothetical protein ABV89_00295 [Priestia aryabhattai]
MNNMGALELSNFFIKVEMNMVLGGRAKIAEFARKQHERYWNLYLKGGGKVTEVENPMVLKNGYGITDPQEKEQEVISVCDGCNNNIVEGQGMLDWGTVHLHDDSICIAKYVRRDSIRKIAGEQ